MQGEGDDADIMIYAMSDIHGCLDELEAKMKFVDLDGDNQLILLGDYIDYGWKSRQVLEYVYELHKEYGEDKQRQRNTIRFRMTVG